MGPPSIAPFASETRGRIQARRARPKGPSSSLGGEHPGPPPRGLLTTRCRDLRDARGQPIDDYQSPTSLTCALCTRTQDRGLDAGRWRRITWIR
jgi:hypothetical protein